MIKIQVVQIVDYHSAMKNEAQGMNPDMAPDGVHPSLKGYKIMEELVVKAIGTILKR